MKTRKINGVWYTLVDERILTDLAGKKYKEATFREGKGKPQDLDGDGVYRYLVLRCPIPKDCKDIDVMRLKDDCIKSSRAHVDNPNKEALVK